MSPNTTATNSGTGLLEQRSLGGIFVHLFALLTGIIGAGLVYLVSDHEFTRANARNALNWHLTVLVLFLIGLVSFALGADELTFVEQDIGPIVPDPLGTILFLIGFLLLFVVGIASFLTLVFAVIATIKAIFGTAWGYPFARPIIGDDQ